MGALRPVDDSLLDSPLDLELSPASSFASSISGSPFDLAMSSADFTSPLLSSFDSPLLESFSLSHSAAGEYPSLFAPAPGADFLTSSTSAAASFAMPAEPQWAPQDMQLPALPPVGSAAPTSSPMEDVKPVLLASPPTLARNESALFDAFAIAAAVAAEAPLAPAQVEAAPAPPQHTVGVETATHTASGKRKSVAQLRKEAAQAMPEQSFKKDKFTGVRNTKKPMIDLDAPTLPKNYLTESATSKKRAGSAKYAASIVNKRQRSTSSATPAPELPQTQPDPIDAENLDEEQLTAIEMKRRSNTLAARKSRCVPSLLPLFELPLPRRLEADSPLPPRLQHAQGSAHRRDAGRDRSSAEPQRDAPGRAGRRSRRLLVPEVGGRTSVCARWRCSRRALRGECATSALVDSFVPALPSPPLSFSLALSPSHLNLSSGSLFSCNALFSLLVCRACAARAC